MTCLTQLKDELWSSRRAPSLGQEWNYNRNKSWTFTNSFRKVVKSGERKISQSNLHEPEFCEKKGISKNKKHNSPVSNMLVNLSTSVQHLMLWWRKRTDTLTFIHLLVPAKQTTLLHTTCACLQERLRGLKQMSQTLDPLQQVWKETRNNQISRSFRISF